MRRLALAALLLLASVEARAADQWRVVTVTGSGSKTSDQTSCYVNTSTVMSCIIRNAASMTNALTVYTVTGSGAITATDYTPTAPTTLVRLAGIGGDATTILVSGERDFIESATVADPSTWTMRVNNNNSGNVFSGILSATSPDKTYQVPDYCNSCLPTTKTRLLNFSLPFSVGNLAAESVQPYNNQLIGFPVASSYIIAMREGTFGRNKYLVYTSGASFAANSQDDQISGNANSYFRQPFAMNNALVAFTSFRQSNGHTYVSTLNTSAGRTEFDKSENLIPGCAWDPTGSLHRGWWVRYDTSPGQMWRTDSISAPTTITHPDSTYDLDSTALQGGVPIAMMCGLDIDQDGSATDNPLVLLDNGKLAYWGEAAAASAYRPPKSHRLPNPALQWVIP